MLDEAPCFEASGVTDFVACADLGFVTLPACSPERNSGEECWCRLQEALGNRFFESPTSQQRLRRVSNNFCATMSDYF